MPAQDVHPRNRARNRWVLLLAGVVAMMAVATAIFAWPLLRSTPGTGLAESLAATENAFAAFIVAETLFVPLEGWLGDRPGRYVLVLVGAALVVLGAVAGNVTDHLRARVIWYAIGGVGAGLVYGGTVAKALKRFTDRKALTVGVTASACAGVLLLALGAIAVAVGTSASLQLLIVLGAAQAAVIVIATLFILDPPDKHSPLPPCD
jgi:OFA family oxalate/formate antiporter-like MFS transporter